MPLSKRKTRETLMTEAVELYVVDTVQVLIQPKLPVPNAHQGPNEVHGGASRGRAEGA